MSVHKNATAHTCQAQRPSESTSFRLESTIQWSLPSSSSKALWKVNSPETDKPREAKIKEEFERGYELEKKKKEFEKYYVLNKYAKQKKRRRNFSIDRSHHYEKILEEAGERKSSGFFKKILLIGMLSAIIFMSIQVHMRMTENAKGFEDVGGKDEKDEQGQKGKRRKNK